MALLADLVAVVQAQEAQVILAQAELELLGKGLLAELDILPMPQMAQEAAAAQVV
jgi:hypothetical protein